MSESNAPPGATDPTTEVTPLRAPEGTLDVFNAYALSQARSDAAAARQGISTGFRELDDQDFRLRPGKLYVVAGRPGEGKTTLLLEMLLRHVEERRSHPTEGGPAVFVTYEENRHEIYLRLLLRQAARRRVDRGEPPAAPPRREAELWLSSGTLDAGSMAERWSDELAAAACVLDDHGHAGLLALVDGDREGGDVNLLLDALRTAAETRGCSPSLVVVDYYQKVRPPKELLYSGSRQAQLQEVADLLRRYAKGEGSGGGGAVPVLVGAQVNREATERQPELHHIREADDLANDAAGILTLHLPEAEDGADFSVKVVKNRDGRRGRTLTFRFYGSCGRVEEGRARPAEVVE